MKSCGVVLLGSLSADNRKAHIRIGFQHARQTADYAMEAFARRNMPDRNHQAALPGQSKGLSCGCAIKQPESLGINIIGYRLDTMFWNVALPRPRGEIFGNGNHALGVDNSPVAKPPPD